MRALYFPIFAFVIACLLASCGPSHHYEEAARDRIATSAWMIERQIPTDPFLLTAYERVHKFGGTAQLYIEGDGLTYVSNQSISRSPTPKYPVALHLATKDHAKNVIYLSRPCQISGMADGETYCHHRYWTKDRFSPEIIESYQQALNELKRRYGFTDFNLIGYEGGAAIAGTLAGMRDDVLSFRSVSGDLADIASPDALYNLPQKHYFGVHDEETPAEIWTSYLTTLSGSPCVSHQVVREVGYEDGWANRWGDLIKQPVMCRNLDALQMPFVE